MKVWAYKRSDHRVGVARREMDPFPAYRKRRPGVVSDVTATAPPSPEFPAWRRSTDLRDPGWPT